LSDSTIRLPPDGLGKRVYAREVTMSGQAVYYEVVGIASGTYVLTSGVTIAVSGNVVVSGQVIISGAVSIESGAYFIGEFNVPVASAVYVVTSGNPLKIPSDSGGVTLVSKEVATVTVKSLAANSGDIYLGGVEEGEYPYSGQGFVLGIGEALNIDIDNIGKVRACAAISGDRVTYIAVK
jgi:hypothetical protein